MNFMNDCFQGASDLAVMNVIEEKRLADIFMFPHRTWGHVDYISLY